MRRYLVLKLVIILSVVLGEAQTILIKNVNVIPMTAETILKNRDVKIEGERITAIESSNSNLTADIVIDGQNQYLLPGLAEMHAHIPVADGTDDALVRETLFLYLANGITTIRGMLGNPYHLELRKQVQAFMFPSPRIYTSSPSLNGNTITTKEEAKQKVTQYAADGYDFLKIHPGIKRDVFDEMAKTANTVGIDFAGHVPVDVGIEHAIASRYATIDHLDGFVEGLAPESKRDQGGFFGVLLANEADDSKIESLVQAAKEQDISVVPTQSLMTRWLAPQAAELLVQEPEMKYISPSLRYSWRQNKEQMLDRLQYTPEQYNRFIELRHKLLRSFIEHNVPVLLGSDAPQVFNVPGFSIHHEIQSLFDAGLSNFQVLKAGTINVASFFQADDRGVVAPGKIADLVLLAGNPLADIKNTKQINAVIYRGKLLSHKEIEEGLQKISDKYNSDSK